MGTVHQQQEMPDKLRQEHRVGETTAKGAFTAARDAGLSLWLAGMIDALGCGDHLPEGPEPEVHRAEVKEIIDCWEKDGCYQPQRGWIWEM